MNPNDPNWQKQINISFSAYQWHIIYATVTLGLKVLKHRSLTSTAASSFLSKVETELMDLSLLSSDEISEIYYKFK